MDHIQTMLERIVGIGNAIVRVTADINFDQIDLSEEKYDPDASAVRSEQHKAESTRKELDKPDGVTEVETGTADMSSRRGSKTQKTDRITNYEISKVSRRVTKPFGTVKRLSVASVVNGTYETIADDKGNTTKKFIQRSPENMQQIEEIVKKAMGFSADREDQVRVTCMEFSITEEEPFVGEKNWLVYGRPYIKPILNLLLILLIFFFVIRPFLKSFREMAKIKQEEEKAIELPEPEKEEEGLPDIAKMSLKDRVIMIANNYPEKTENWVRGWINEVGSAAKLGQK